MAGRINRTTGRSAYQRRKPRNPCTGNTDPKGVGSSRARVASESTYLEHRKSIIVVFSATDTAAEHQG